MGKNVAAVLLKAEKEGNGMKKKIPSYHKKEWLAAFLFLLPNLAGFLVFTFLPVVLGFMISLTDYSGYGAADFVGLDNYLRMFRDSSFANSPAKINVFEIFKLYMPEDADDISKRIRVI